MYFLKCLLIIIIVASSCTPELESKKLKKRNEIENIQINLVTGKQKITLYSPKGYLDETKNNYQLEKINLTSNSYKLTGNNVTLKLKPLNLNIKKLVLSNKVYDLNAKKVSINDTKATLDMIKIQNPNFQLEAKEGLSDSSFKLIRLHKVKAVFK